MKRIHLSLDVTNIDGETAGLIAVLVDKLNQQTTNGLTRHSKQKLLQGLINQLKPEAQAHAHG